jgi:hypothetical protein
LQKNMPGGCFGEEEGKKKKVKAGDSKFFTGVHNGRPSQLLRISRQATDF